MIFHLNENISCCYSYKKPNILVGNQLFPGYRQSYNPCSDNHKITCLHVLYKFLIFLLR